MIFVPDLLTVYFFMEMRETTESSTKTKTKERTKEQSSSTHAAASTGESAEVPRQAPFGRGMHVKEVLKDHMTVYVKTTKGKTIRIDIDKKQTVEQISAVERRTQIRKEQQRLVSQGRILSDKQKIERYNIKGGMIEMSMLMVVVRRETSRCPPP